MKQPKIISIIGGTGKMGQKFRKSFEKQGYKVLISGLSTKLTNKEIASRGDVVIVSVPIKDTENVIKEITPVLQEGVLLTDFTSVKVMPIVAMQQAVSKNITVIGGHPLFGPTTGFKNQNFILCYEKKNGHVEWYKNFLQSLGLNVLSMTKEEHDKHMAVIQCLTHFSTLSLGSALQKIDYNLEDGEKIATPVYLIRFYGVGRILAQDPQLYADIQLYNPFAKEIIKKYKDSVDELFVTVQMSNAKKFCNIFKRSKDYFGMVAVRSMDITDKLIKILS